MSTKINSPGYRGDASAIAPISVVSTSSQSPSKTAKKGQSHGVSMLNFVSRVKEEPVLSEKHEAVYLHQDEKKQTSGQNFEVLELQPI